MGLQTQAAASPPTHPQTQGMMGLEGNKEGIQETWASAKPRRNLLCHGKDPCVLERDSEPVGVRSRPLADLIYKTGVVPQVTKPGLHRVSCLGQGGLFSRTWDHPVQKYTLNDEYD